jgi:hypothetical protein
MRDEFEYATTYTYHLSSYNKFVYMHNVMVHQWLVPCILLTSKNIRGYINYICTPSSCQDVSKYMSHTLLLLVIGLKPFSTKHIKKIMLVFIPVVHQGIYLRC